jgi:non-specific serine/threonine protein kinase
LLDLGKIAVLHGDDAEAERLFEEGLDLRRRIGDFGGISFALGALGNLARVRGDDNRARGFFEEALAVARRIGDGGDVARHLGALGHLAWRRGDHARARALLREALVREIETGGRVWACLFRLGLVAIAEGSAARGTRLLGAIDSFTRMRPGVYDPDEMADLHRSLAAARASLGETAFARAWAEGQALTREQAIAHALEEGGGWADGSGVLPPTDH